MRTKNYARILGVFAGILIFLCCFAAHAQTAKTGGSSFDNAVSLEAGNYSGGAITSGQMVYYYINVGQGQQLNVKAIFTPESTSYGTINHLYFFDKDRKELIDKFDTNYSTLTLTASWLVNSDEDTSKIYIAFNDDSSNTKSYTFEASLTDRYDAGTTKDAASDFDKALSISAGTIKGYLSTKAGNDTKDMFKLTPDTSGTYTFKLTPPSDDQLSLTVYDKNRSELDAKYSNNNGEIITSSITATKGEDLYIAVFCQYGCSTDLVESSLIITPPGGTNVNSAAANTNTTVANTNIAAVNSSVNAVSNTNVANTNTTNANEENVNANVNKVVAANTTANVNTEEKTKSKTTLYIIIGAGVIVVVIIIIVILLAKKKGKPKETPPQSK